MTRNSRNRAIFRVIVRRRLIQTSTRVNIIQLLSFKLLHGNEYKGYEDIKERIRLVIFNAV